MVEITNLSSVGIGTYRMGIEDRIHFDALHTAVKHGYNLIDTATNYSRGESEVLIGQFIQQYPEYSKQLFIVSKAGYIPSKNLQTKAFAGFLEQNVAEIAVIENDFEYSLDPNFIAYQLENSLRKLNREYIDVYLLHNPERYLQSKNLNSPTQLYQSITKAFELLEEKVEEGKIRYYGVSSNCMFNPQAKGAIDCARLLEIAASIRNKHHFKFIQFPFNFKEKMALEMHYDKQSLLAFAKDNGLITIGNRPLNMNENGFEFRLVTHEKELSDLNAIAAKACIELFLKEVNQRVAKLTNGESKGSDFEPIQLLEKYYTNFKSKGAVDAFFAAQMNPFLTTIFEEDWQQFEPMLNELHRYTVLYALQAQTNKTRQFLAALEEEGTSIKENSVLTACHAYLNESLLDHVLVGLRKPAYVLALNGEFNRVMSMS
ncbi:aldo/keto reductase [Aureispira anguillae]|uniref:Aldo/keto reductase n=1 Tax=Aureispira anguillae TaxID=2864201 RepID=A0A915YI76_9BACT|nr:aldo/keto reductase [Aureispira anguillae]BDS13649.1 aldo/keto reductase [Aureispira anguillae]